MGLFDKLFGKKSPASAPPSVDARNDPNLIRVFDEFGRELFITREQWRTNVLPGALESNRADPERLAGVVISALQDGFAADVLATAAQMHHRDPAGEQATCIYGIALMGTQRSREAEQLFEAYLKTHGESAAVLTNLAKVYADRKEVPKADEILWRALKADPNFENGFNWHIALMRERGGAAAELEALQRIAALPGSWRSQLWLARKALESQQPEQAIALYREALSRVGENMPADFLMQMSGDLGQHGRLVELLELAEPHFVPETHGLQVGNNLIKANLDLHRIDNASKILNQLYALRRPDWKEQLAFWNTQIAKARVASGPPVAVGSTPLAVNLMVIDGPVWLKPDSPVSDLFPMTRSGVPSICFHGSSAELASPPESIERQLSDAPGRMSRALPLFLAEQVAFMTEAHTQVLIPWMNIGGGGFVLGGVASSDSDIAENSKRADANCEYAVGVHLRTNKEPWCAELRLVRLRDLQCVGALSVSFPMSRPEDAVPVLAQRLLELLHHNAAARPKVPPAHYQVPEGANFPYYLLRLEQLLTLRCLDAAGDLSGEREIIDGNLNLCLACPENVVTRVLLIQTMLTMKKIRPEVVAEFHNKVSRLQEQYPFPGPIQRSLGALLKQME